jgi:ribosomal protein S18 acetylase RimI-like enzyme
MSPPNKRMLRELEELVVDAWPAAETAELAGWLLRATGGPTRRGNSVAPLDFDSDQPLEQRVVEVEAWYAARGQKAAFHLGPSAQPKELEACLIARGYRKEGATAFAIAEPDALAAGTRSELLARVEPKPSAGWLDVASSGRFGADLAGFQGFIRRLGSRCRFASALDTQGKVVAACLGIASEDRLGVYAMLTLPEARRRGAARALLHALAESARADAMRAVYLLVELENAPARALYRGTGFVDVYEYGYRVQP